MTLRSRYSHTSIGFHLLSSVLLLAVAPGLLSQSTSADRRTDVHRGTWSSETISLFNTWGGLDSNPGRKLSLPSPDGKKIIEVNGETVTLRINGRRYRTKLGEKTNAELGWSPDSKYFFLTWTDGGVTGSWHTDLYLTGPKGLEHVRGFEANARGDFDRMIRGLPVPAEFAKEPGRSYWRSEEYCYPNVVGAQWLNASKELLLSVLVPNVGICRYMSQFQVYRVAVPSGRILEHYSAKQAHRKFNSANLPIIAE